MRGFERGNLPYFEMCIDELLVGLIFDGVEWVSLGLLGYEQVLEFDGVVIKLGGWQFHGGFL